MKLRIRGDSVRLRLTRSEVRTLLDTGSVEDATHFPGESALRYVLDALAPDREVVARFAAGTLVVSLPAAVARRWGESEQVEIRASLPFAGGELAVLVEKDFPCLTNRPGEDDSDAFRRERPVPEP